MRRTPDEAGARGAVRGGRVRDRGAGVGGQQRVGRGEEARANGGANGIRPVSAEAAERSAGVRHPSTAKKRPPAADSESLQRAAADSLRVKSPRRR